MIKIITLVCMTFSLILSSCLTKEDQFSFFEGNTMGTTYHIKVVPQLSKQDEKKVHQGIKDVLERVNAQMSTYQDDSELNKFNVLNKDKLIKVSSETYGIFMRALDISRETKGAFDITVGPLVNLWGFGAKGRKRETPPSTKDIEKVKTHTGFDLVQIDYVNERIGKRHPNLYVDLAAIAKGYGVDAVSTYLSEQGYGNYMVEVGGEVRVSGYKDKEKTKKWLIAIEKPLVGQRENGRVLPVVDLAIATSGDYRNYFEYNGKRYSHTINPVTGFPVAHNLSSVTVLMADCMDADAYATALMVMGEGKGLDFVNEKKIKAIFYVKNKNSHKEVLSKEMIKYLEAL